MVVGIDEAGRGPWAGPLVFGAVVLGGEPIEGLNDSKKLTKKRREELENEIRLKAKSFGLGWVSAAELDEIGMSAACRLGCRRALERIDVPYSEIIIDGTVNFLQDTGKGPYVTTLAKADALIPSVSAASILAKVARDRFMSACDELFPGYAFGSHAGYGTAGHRAALESLGVCPLHRQSFAPIAEFLGGSLGNQSGVKTIGDTTRDIGNASESVAAAYLVSKGYDIIERNWRTRACEIDIVAKKEEVLYFVEVKHRTIDRQGGGLAAITPKKLAQMEFAAKMYAHYTKQDNAAMRLAVITTQNTDYSIVAFEILSE
jgi:ribonuclease HII